MKAAPNMGDVVNFVGDGTIGPCQGKVIAIYPAYRDETDRHYETFIGIEVPHPPQPLLDHQRRFGVPLSKIAKAA